LQEHFTKDHYTPLEEIERSDISHFLNQLGWDITKISKIKIWYKSKHESKSKPIEIKTQEHLGIFTEFLSKLKQSDIFNEGATIENNDKTPGRKKDFRVTVLSGFCFDLYCLLEDYAKRSKNEKFYKSKGTISNRAIHLFIVKILYEMDLLTDDEKRSYEAKSQVEKENSLADFVRKKIQAYQENDLDKDSDPNDPAIGIL
ncbi:MAG: hypothetical protein K9G45_08810, partial [Bacteroidales bacterium]|nr:hypothetical protein [Bacteroidales bacterium]